MAVGVGYCVYGYAAGRPGPVPTYRVERLTRGVFAGRVGAGERVTALFDFPLTPTADPRVWEYRPGVMGKLPAAVRVEFLDSAAVPVGVIVRAVTGVVSFETDLLVRPNGVPGVVVISEAVAGPP